MKEESISQMIERQEGYGPFMVMGLHSALSPGQRNGSLDVLHVFAQALKDIPDDVVAKTVLQKILYGLWIELGGTAQLAPNLVESSAKDMSA